MSAKTLPFSSKFDGGECPGCSLPILKGQRIQYNDDEVIEHEMCDIPGGARDMPYMLDMMDGTSMHDDAAVLTLQRPTCTKCFLELPTSLICGNC